jgi:bacterioferritin
MIPENLVAERVAIESYKERISYIGVRDSTIGRLLESILAKEEEHADELSSMLRQTTTVLLPGAAWSMLVGGVARQAVG